MPVYPDGSVQVFGEVMRISTLDVNGFVAAGSAVYVTNQFVKATFTPNKETGVDLTQVNAAGDLAAHYKHGDMAKYYDAAIQLTTQDPIASAMLTGGVVFTDSGAALGTVTPGTATAQTTLGSLPAATYGYRYTLFNSYGETLPSTEVTAAVATGTSGLVVVGVPTITAGALGWVVYGRTPGGEQKLAVIRDIGSQATSAASGTGTPTTLSVTALTKPIPQGFTFQIAGDTNTPKIVFTTTAAAGIGATVLAVTASQSITTTIAAGAIQPVFVDTGALTPAGTPPTSDTTAGPGNDVGVQAPALGVVGNPNGVGIEIWAANTIRGTLASYLPYTRWVFPGVRNLMDEAREFGPTLQLPSYAGQGFENPNWGSGPMGDWTRDSSKVWQRAREGGLTLPTPGLTTIQATV